jgi:acyl-coenzyme A synthetase/AMP-(fatty) acid ligase
MMLSILAIDAIALPLSPAFPVEELKYIVDNAEVKVLLASARNAARAQEILAAGLQGDPILDVREKITRGSGHLELPSLQDLNEPRGGMMLYTSGTTNRPVTSRSIVGS